MRAVFQLQEIVRQYEQGRCPVRPTENLGKKWKHGKGGLQQREKELKILETSQREGKVFQLLQL